jgi:phosphoribosylaminoimidazole carboxylase
LYRFHFFVFTMLASPKVGVLGGGQLGRMLVEAANRLNVQMNVLDAENAPAKQISAHHDHVTGSFADRASLRKLAESCEVLTTEIEHVDTYALEEVASEVKVEPSWKTIRIIQDKFQQKEYLSQFQIPMAEYRELRKNSMEELTMIGEELGYPLMLKSKTQAYDGRGKRSASILAHVIYDPAAGNYRVKSQGDISSALKALEGRPLYAEKWANFRMVGTKLFISGWKLLLTL